jgi:hypothetical protein
MDLNDLILHKQSLTIIIMDFGEQYTHARGKPFYKPNLIATETAIPTLE